MGLSERDRRLLGIINKFEKDRDSVRTRQEIGAAMTDFQRRKKFQDAEIMKRLLRGFR